MQYKIRQLGLSAILDQAINLVKNQFGLLFQIMLMTLIPWHMLSGVIQLSVLPTPPKGGSQEDMVRYFQSVMSYLPLIYGLLILGALFVLPIANAAIIYSVAEIYLGKKVTAFEALKKGLSRMGALIGTAMLMGIAIFGGFVLCVIPGIACALLFALSQHVVVLESLSGTKAMMRSKELIWPHMGTLFILGLIVTAISVSVSAVAAIIPQEHVQLVVAILLNAVTTIFSAAVFVVFYFSCRCGLENFDLEHLAASVGESIEPAVEVGETLGNEPMASS